MPLSLEQQALEVLPLGNTRLHRALLRRDLKGIAQWIEAGSDPWAMSADLPDTVLDRFWPRRKQLGTPRRLQMPAVALALLLVDHETWPLIQPWVKEMDLNRDRAGYVLMALWRSSPGREWRLRAADRRPASPSNPVPDADLIFEQVLASGVMPPSQDVSPDTPQSPFSFWSDLPRSWRSAMEAHHGLERLYSTFAPRRSPLDRHHADSHNADRVDDWLIWLRQGMPVTIPQESLSIWISDFPRKGRSLESFAEGLRLLVERGADLDQVTSATRTLSPTALALLEGRGDLAEVIQRERGLTLHDGAQGPDSLTGAAETFQKIAKNAWMAREAGGFLRETQARDLFTTRGTARGWQQSIGSLIDSDEFLRWDNLEDVLIRARQLAIQFQLPDIGEEQGQRRSTTDIFLDTYAHGALKNKASHVSEVVQLKRLTECAQQMGVSNSDFLDNLTDQLAQKADLWPLLYWMEALQTGGIDPGRLRMAVLDRLNDVGTLFNAHPEMGQWAMDSLARIGIQANTPNADGVTYWEQLTWRTRVALFHDTAFQGKGPSLRELTEHLEATPAAAVFIPFEKHGFGQSLLLQWIAVFQASQNPQETLTFTQVDALQETFLQDPKSPLPNREALLHYRMAQDRLQTLESAPSGPRRSRYRG